MAACLVENQVTGHLDSDEGHEYDGYNDAAREEIWAGTEDPTLSEFRAGRDVAKTKKRRTISPLYH